MDDFSNIKAGDVFFTSGGVWGKLTRNVVSRVTPARFFAQCGDGEYGFAKRNGQSTDGVAGYAIAPTPEIAAQYEIHRRASGA